MRDFFRSLPTVSDGCAPLDSHALIAGAFRLLCFLMGSYHPSSSRGAPSLRLRLSIAMMR
jgi:hypothetical protein